MTTENMRIMLKGVIIDDRTTAYITKRLGSIEKLMEKINRVEVEIDMNKKGKFRVEVMVKGPRDLYRAEETTESIEGSVDIVVDELKNQMRKNKEKLATLKMRGRRSIKKKTVLDKNARF
jgi:ribosomal subunit interface protein